MYRWLLRRVLISLPVLLGITVLSFVFVRLAPGDPIRMMVNPEYMAGGAEDYIARRRAELGLDQPLPVQYVAWLSEVARGNLGYSFFDRRPVGDILKERVWPTTELMGTALLLALLVGVPLGLLAAIRQYSVLDYLSAVVSLGTISTPSFFLGLAAIYIFSLKLNLLPTSGMFTAGAARNWARLSPNHTMGFSLDTFRLYKVLYSSAYRSLCSALRYNRQHHMRRPSL